MAVPVFILFGPTASGKTKILLDIFAGGSSLAAEVVSADSMQVYRGMDIGTAKPSAEERELLPHHLIDVRNPNEQFNAGDFVRLADEACMDITSRGKLPVISGGTGFYLKNFILGLPEAPPSNTDVRTALRQELKERRAEALRNELATGDPVSAGRIHQNDEYRLLRALEVLRLCGQPLSSFQVSGGAPADAFASRPDYRFISIGLSCQREELYKRINLRCAVMFRQGLPEEVAALFSAGYSPKDPGLRAIGYREFFVEDLAEGAQAGEYRLSRDIAGVQALVAQNSRRYAKRQLSFFSGMPEVKWIEAANTSEAVLKIRREIELFLGG